MATSRRGGDMMGHVLKGYMCGVGKAEHDHAEGISHEDKVHSRLIEQAGGGIVQAVRAAMDGPSAFVPVAAHLSRHPHSCHSTVLTDASPREKKILHRAAIFEEVVHTEGVPWLVTSQFSRDLAGLRLIERFQVFTNRNAMPGQAHGGAYVSKGLQDKAALDYPRVWNDELLESMMCRRGRGYPGR